MTSQQIIILFAAITNLVLSFFILLKNPKSNVNRSFCFFSFFTSLWCAFNLIGLVTLQTMYVRLTWGIAALLPFTMLIFCFNFLKIKINKFKKIFIYFPGIFFTLISPTNLLVKKISIIGTNTQETVFEAGPLYFLWVIYLIGYVIWITYLLLKYYFKFTGIKRAQIRYIILGIVGFAFWGIFVGIILPIFKIYQFTNVDSPATLLIVAFTTYTVVKHRLFDIIVIIRKGLIFSFLLLTITTVYVLAVFLFYPFLLNIGLSPLLISFLAAVVLTTTFKPIENFFTRMTDKLFFKKRYDFEKIMIEFSQKIPTLINLKQIVDLIYFTLSKSIKVKEILLFSLNNKKEIFKNFDEKKELSFDLNNIFIKNLIQEKKPIVREELEAKILKEKSKNIKNEKMVLQILKNHRMALVLPLIIKQKLIGFLTLGEKLSGDPFFTQDLNLLSNLSAQISISLENSNLYEDLTSERDNLNSIIYGFKDALIVCDKKRNVIFLNPAAEKIFDLKLNQLTQRGKKLSESSHLKKIFQVMNSKEKEVTLSDETERDRIFQINEAPLKKEGGILGSMIILHDITRERAIDKMKSDFISIAAHQLRTPLSAVKWVVRMILDGDAGEVNEEQKDLLEKGYQSNERMIHLVNDMLDVSRIEEGRFLFNFSDESLAKIINDIINAVSAQANQKNIKISFDKPFSSLPAIKIDKEKIYVAIQNLLENAIRYSFQNGNVVISIKYDKVSKEIETAIKDEGIGISKKQQDRIFNKFFRGDNVIKMQTEGTGLGLFIAKNIIEAHKGKIWFKSEEGKGTTFYFRLPC